MTSLPFRNDYLVVYPTSLVLGGFKNLQAEESTVLFGVQIYFIGADEGLSFL